MRQYRRLLCSGAAWSLIQSLGGQNWVKAGGVASFLSGLKVFNEEVVVASALLGVALLPFK